MKKSLIKMKKSLIIVSMTFGVAVAVVGAGLVGGLYGSYSNYQALATAYNIAKKEAGSNSNSLPSFDSQVSAWNDNQAKLSADQRNALNKANQAEKEDFNKKYASSDDYVKKNTPSGITLTQDQINQLKDAYDLYEAQYSMDYNYNADQGGVIAGSVLLAIGLAAYIVFSVILLVIWRKEKKAS